MVNQPLPAPAPMRRFAWLVLVALITVAAALLLWQFSSVVILFVAAVALAAAIRPLIDGLARLRIPRSIGATVMVLLVVGALLTLLAASGYVLAEELPQAAAEMQADYARLRTALTARSGWEGNLGAQLPPLEGFEDMVARTQLTPLADSAAPASAAAAAGAAITTTTTTTVTTTSTTPAAASAATPTTDTTTQSEWRASGLLRLFAGTTSSVAGVLTQLLVLVFLSLYWSLERDWFERLWLSVLPPARRRAARDTLHDLETSVGAHLRSEVVQSVAVFCLMYIGLRLMGAHYAFLMAWAAALASIIPLVGWPAALLPVVALGLLTSPLVALGGGVYLTLLLVLMEFVVEPRLDVRRRAGSILGLIVALVMLQAFGLVGLLVAAPVAVAVQILMNHWQLQASSAVPQPSGDAVEKLEARVAQLRAALGQVDTEIPKPTRSLYERLQMLIAEAEKSL